MRTSEVIEIALRKLHTEGYKISTTKWQGLESPQPMIEVLNVSLQSDLPQDQVEAATECSPNLPWADLHFEERVGGIPSNPGKTYQRWPFWRGGFIKEGYFDHTYMERLNTNPLMGVRYKYGNLHSVVELLKREPDTRQAFIPVWFPEDTGVKFGGRVPCTIGYHILIRDGKVHIVYYLRSCDARRHFFDDLYLCARLALWIRDMVNTELQMGTMSVHITSFHIFESDSYWLKKTIRCAE